jgi:hypothetical protein
MWASCFRSWEPKAGKNWLTHGMGVPEYYGVVLTSEDVRAVSMVAETGEVFGPYPTDEIPRELVAAGRAVLMPTPPFESDYVVVAHGADGREIGRLGARAAMLPPGFR